MKKVLYPNGEVRSIEFCKGVAVHAHIHYPEDFLITIKPLGISGKILCKKSASDKEITEAVYKVFEKEQEKLSDLFRLFRNSTKS